MKVTNEKSPELQRIQQQNLSKAGALERKSNEAKKGGDLSSASTVAFSPKIRDFKEISKLAKSSPDLDLEKINRLKTDIQNGSYRVAATDIADKMVDEHVTNELLSRRKS